MATKVVLPVSRSAAFFEVSSHVHCGCDPDEHGGY